MYSVLTQQKVFAIYCILKRLWIKKFNNQNYFWQLEDIKKTAVLAIEGGRDDITGVGQTKSVINLCKNLPDNMKKYVLADKVGHYGLFSGSKFRKIILPEIINFANEHKTKGH